ncbi:MAG: aspartate/glutamate racemase family protein [Rhodospirillaceae bacterium]|nr:aspartate/glutamate racemase family protein [Rhodospirillaceae bacterium]MDE0619368.1 aspartate/glutamate racemase family protein [Rhodospirillaceae bacterium]
MHIGLIGGIGPAATEFYYRHLVRRHEAAGQPMELTIVHAHVHTLAANAIAGRAEAQAREYAALTARLKGAGAEAVAITSIGGHFCFDEFEPVSPLPVLNVAPAIAAGLRARGIRKIGLIGTAVAMTSGIYGALSDIGTVIPEGDDLQTTNDVYIALARAGAVSEEGRATLFRIGRDLVERQGAEAVLLAGTDLFVAFDGRDPGYPTIDGALLHVDAIARASMFGLAAYPG